MSRLHPASHLHSLIHLLIFLPFARSLDIIFCQATSKDVSEARRLILMAKMNPLSISEEHLVVARSARSNISDKEDDSEESFLGFGQIRPLTDAYSELASLYVLPQFRRRGIGMALTQELLNRHDAKFGKVNESVLPQVCLLTLRPTMKLYEKCGFREVKDMSTMPTMLQLEYQIGLIVSKLLSNELVCMSRPKEET